MRHDALCAKYGLDSDPGQGVWGYEPPIRPCDCSRFAEVRRDALDKAREAVQSVPPTWGSAVAMRVEALAAIDALLGDVPSPPCEVCSGTGVVECWDPGGPCPEGQSTCECCGPCRSCAPRSKP